MSTETLKPRCCLAGLLPTFLSLSKPIPGQDRSSVTLNVIPIQAHGDTVTALPADDVRLVGGHVEPQIISVGADQNQTPLPIVVVFDFVSMTFAERGAMVYSMKRELEQLPESVPMYLYILGPLGQVLAVAPVAGLPLTVGKDGGQNLGPILDKALDRAGEPRVVDQAVEYLRWKGIYEGLDALGMEMASKPGHKQLLWISRGLPRAINFPDGQNFTPQIQQLAARLNTSRITLYELDPSLSFHSFGTDGASMLAEGTGGRIFGSSDLAKVVKQLRKDAVNTFVVTYLPFSR